MLDMHMKEILFVQDTIKNRAPDLSTLQRLAQLYEAINNVAAAYTCWHRICMYSLPNLTESDKAICYFARSKINELINQREPDNVTDATILRIRNMLGYMEGNGYLVDGYWKNFATEHFFLLKMFGYSNFKRTINGWYCQKFPDEPKNDSTLFFAIMKMIYDHYDSGYCFPRTALNSSVDLSDVEAILGIYGTEENYHQLLHEYKWKTCLLWDLAMTQDNNNCLINFSEPMFGNPYKISNGCNIISQDHARSALEIAFIDKYVGLNRVSRIAEIGAGYGRLAWLFRKLKPNVEYSIFDIPPTLAIAERYLTDCFGTGNIVGDPLTDNMQIPCSRDKINLYLPTRLKDMPDHYFDLIVNISSFDEMQPEEVYNYFELIHQKLRGYLYLKGWFSYPEKNYIHTMLPYNNKWRRIIARKAPDNPAFLEQIFTVNLD